MSDESEFSIKSGQCAAQLTLEASLLASGGRLTMSDKSERCTALSIMGGIDDVHLKRK